MIAIFLLLAVVSCKKSGDGWERVSGTGLTGSWVTHDYINDIGDGDGSWRKYSGDPEVISFDAAGKGSIFSNGVQSSGFYQATSDSTMDIRGGSITSQARYFLAGDTLTISGFCIEACVTRYLRAKID